MIELCKGLRIDELGSRTCYYIVILFESAEEARQMFELIKALLARKHMAIQSRVVKHGNSIYVLLPDELVIKYREYMPDGKTIKYQPAWIDVLEEHGDKIVLRVTILKISR